MKTHKIFINGNWYTACAGCGELAEKCKCKELMDRGEQSGRTQKDCEIGKKNR